MKKIIYSMFLIVTTLAFFSCDNETDDLFKGLVDGKMAIKIGDATVELMECTFVDYGGEVFITAATETGSTISLMYGDWNNTVPLSVKTYTSQSSATIANHMYVTSSWGSSDDDTNSAAIVSVSITKVTDTVIEGTVTGKVLSTSGSLVSIDAAFKATKVMP